jgi:hypothetical protein
MKNIRAYSDCAVWTNLLFVAPLAFALYLHLYLYAGVLITSMVFSVLYHHAHESEYSRPDRLAAYTLIVGNAVLCVFGGLGTLYVTLLIMLSMLAVFFRNRELRVKDGYAFNHALWHGFAACVTLVSILIYAERL